MRTRLRRVLAPLRSTPLHPLWLVERQHRNRAAWIASRARGTVLDIGCADRSITRQLSTCDQYVGLDYPVTADGLYGTRPDLYGDARRLPIADNCFDTVMFLDVLEHVHRPDLAIAEAARVLKRDGRMLLTIPFAYPMHDQPHDYQRITEHGLVQLLHDTGLQAKTITEIGTAAESAASNFCIALAQGAIDSMEARSWRSLLVPVVGITVLLANLAGWSAARLFPTGHLMPGGYYVEAGRR